MEATQNQMSNYESVGRAYACAELAAREAFGLRYSLLPNKSSLFFSPLREFNAYANHAAKAQIALVRKGRHSKNYEKFAEILGSLPIGFTRNLQYVSAIERATIDQGYYKQISGH